MVEDLWIGEEDQGQRDVHERAQNRQNAHGRTPIVGRQSVRPEKRLKTDRVVVVGNHSQSVQRTEDEEAPTDTVPETH